MSSQETRSTSLLKSAGSDLWFQPALPGAQLPQPHLPMGSCQYCGQRPLFNWRKITFQCCDGFGHASTSVSRRHTRVRSLLNPLPPPSPPHPSSYLRAPALGSLCHISNSHWLSISHTANVGVRFKALLSNHPTLSLFLPQCPKVCSERCF